MTIRSNIEKTLDNAEKLNGTLNSFLSIERDSAAARSKELDATNERGPLHGVAIAVKDNICIK